MSLGPGGPPPYEPWHRRAWRGYNRPFPGCGCLWLLIVIVIIWWVVAAFAYPPARFGWW